MPTVVRVVTPPAGEPVSLDEARAHLRWDASFETDNDLILHLISAARRYCETVGKITCVDTTFDLVDDGFPVTDGLLSRDARAFYSQFSMGGRAYGAIGHGAAGSIVIPRSPLRSVTSITYLGADGAPAVLPPETYTVIAGAPGRVAPVHGAAWPTPLPQAGCVTLRFVAGYGDAAAVPANVKAAILLMLGHLYENREAVTTGSVVTLPLAVSHLLAVEPNSGGYS